MSQTDNEDWIKGHSWDMWAGWKLVSNLEELFYSLGVTGAPLDVQKERVKHFLTLRSSLAMPEPIKMEVDAFLAN